MFYIHFKNKINMLSVANLWPIRQLLLLGWCLNHLNIQWSNKKMSGFIFNVAVLTFASVNVGLKRFSTHIWFAKHRHFKKGKHISGY